MKKITLLFYIGIIMVFSTSLVACSKKINWDFSKENKSFSGASSKIQVRNGEKIPLSGGGFAIRIYYEITNLDSKSENAYSLLLNEINGIFQNEKELETTSIIFADIPNIDSATNVTVKPNQTVEVYVDYRLSNYESDIDIEFTESVGEETRATLSLKMNYFKDVTNND